MTKPSKETIGFAKWVFAHTGDTSHGDVYYFPNFGSITMEKAFEYYQLELKKNKIETNDTSKNRS